MWEAIGHILPLAFAAALSSVPISATILILLSTNPNRSSVPYLIGMVVGMAAGVTGFTVLATTLPGRDSSAPHLAAALAQVVLGLALVVAAVLRFRRLRRAPSSSEPRWLPP